jgi:STE24 endopeptidase
MSQRRVAVSVALVGAIAFCLITVRFVPWDPTPGGPLSAPDPSRYFTADEVARGEGFTRWARTWSLCSLGVSLALSALLGFTRLGAALVDRLPGRWWARVPLAVAAVTATGRVATLPFAFALRRHGLDYELSTQSWTAFAVDLLTAQLLETAVLTGVMLVLVGAARRWHRAWPAVVGGVLAAAVVVGSLLYPLLVEPLFNSFSPLPEGQLRTQILALADREDVDVGDVLVADASRRTTTLNAYVSGLGPTRRVIVYDNLVADLGERETLAVVAHELAHAKNQDVVIGTALGAAGMVAAVGLLGLVVPRRSDRGQVAEPRSVPLVLALVAVATVLAGPVESGISRRIETRADGEALRVTGDPAGFIALQQELARRSAADLTPPAWVRFWFGTHPTTLLRIANAEQQAAG